MIIAQYGILLPQGFDRLITTEWVNHFFEKKGEYFLHRTDEISRPEQVIDHYVSTLNKKVGVEFKLSTGVEDVTLENLMLTVPYDEYPFQVFHRIFPNNDEKAIKELMYRRSNISHELFKMRQRKGYCPRDDTRFPSGPSSSPQYQPQHQAP